MAWCRRATCHHYLSQRWPSFISPCGCIKRNVNEWMPEHNERHSTDDIFRHIFLNRIFCILIQIEMSSENVKFTINHRYFRWWHDAEETTSHCQKQRRLMYAPPGLDELLPRNTTPILWKGFAASTVPTPDIKGEGLLSSSWQPIFGNSQWELGVITLLNDIIKLKLSRD